MSEVEFDILLEMAQSGINRAKHKIWEEVCEKQMKAFFKFDYIENAGLAYTTYFKAITLYDMSKLTTGKHHRWFFPAYLKQRIRYALQDERQRMSHPCRITDYAFKNGDIPIRVEAGDDLAYVEY